MTDEYHWDVNRPAYRIVYTVLSSTLGPGSCSWQVILDLYIQNPFWIYIYNTMLHCSDGWIIDVGTKSIRFVYVHAVIFALNYFVGTRAVNLPSLTTIKLPCKTYRSRDANKLHWSQLSHCNLTGITAHIICDVT